MTKAMVISETGGPDVLTWTDVDVAEPGPGEARVRNTAIGLNFIDTYFRQGIFPLPKMPGVIGAEAAAVVVSVGEGVDYLSVGDRVVYSAGFGSYSEERVIAADRLVPIPDAIDDVTAAGSFSKGTTAEFLLLRAWPKQLEKGDRILVQAAAGGVGSILCQWATHLGAEVIGTAGSAAKVETAKQNGCTQVIDYSSENFVERVKEITEGAGVPVVFDAVGKDTFEGSLDCLSPRGFMISFGTASGPPPMVDPTQLMMKGSLYVTRASLLHYNASRADLTASANALFDVMAKGAVKINIGATYALKDAAQAHMDLAARKLSGSTVLLP